GLWNRQSRVRSAAGSGCPSTTIRSCAPTTKAGVSSRRPFTRTRPSAIQRSASRREHRPARARTLAMRSPLTSASVIARSSGRADEGGEDLPVPGADVVLRVPLHAEAEALPGVLDALDDA